MWPFEYKYNVQCFWLKRILNIIIQVGIFREYRNKCFWRPKAQAGIFREYQNKCFWRPKCFGKAPPQIMPLRILSGKGAVQIMPFRKLGGKCLFLLRFCTRKRSETYHFLLLLHHSAVFLVYWHFLWWCQMLSSVFQSEGVNKARFSAFPVKYQ